MHLLLYENAAIHILVHNPPETIIIIRLTRIIQYALIMHWSRICIGKYINYNMYQTFLSYVQIENFERIKNNTCRSIKININ